MSDWLMKLADDEYLLWSTCVDVLAFMVDDEMPVRTVERLRELAAACD